MQKEENRAAILSRPLAHSRAREFLIKLKLLIDSL